MDPSLITPFYSEESVNFATILEKAYFEPCEEKIQPPLTISQFDSFEALKKAFEMATTIEEQIKFSCIIPLIFDQTTKRFVFVSHAEKLYHDSINKKPPTLDLTKSKLYIKRHEQKTI
jgi:hypothetical protein